MLVTGKDGAPRGYCVVYEFKVWPLAVTGVMVTVDTFVVTSIETSWEVVKAKLGAVIGLPFSNHYLV